MHWLRIRDGDVLYRRQKCSQLQQGVAAPSAAQHIPRSIGSVQKGVAYMNVHAYGNHGCPPVVLA